LATFVGYHHLPGLGT